MDALRSAFEGFGEGGTEMKGRGRRRLSRIAALGLTVALLGPDAAVGAALHPKLVAKVGYGTVADRFCPVGGWQVARCVRDKHQLGRLGQRGRGGGDQPVRATSGPLVQALAWSGRSGGSPNGIPGLAVMPTGALRGRVRWVAQRRRRSVGHHLDRRRRHVVGPRQHRERLDGVRRQQRDARRCPTARRC